MIDANAVLLPWTVYLNYATKTYGVDSKATRYVQTMYDTYGPDQGPAMLKTEDMLSLLRDMDSGITPEQEAHYTRPMNEIAQRLDGMSQEEINTLVQLLKSGKLNNVVD